MRVVPKFGHTFLQAVIFKWEFEGSCQNLLLQSLSPFWKFLPGDSDTASLLNHQCVMIYGLSRLVFLILALHSPYTIKLLDFFQ